MRQVTTVWHPWREMNRLRRDFDQMFQGNLQSAAQRPAEFPPVNVWQNETGLLVTAELPGTDSSQLDVALEKNALTIRGQRTEAHAEAEENRVRRERWHSEFSRTVELPFDVDPDKCEATYEKGVLTIKLERAAELQPRKLTIKSA